VAVYKLFLLRDGDPVRKIQIECPDDLDALDAACALARDRTVEVHTGERFVARVKAGDEPPNLKDGQTGGRREAKL